MEPKCEWVPLHSRESEIFQIIGPAELQNGLLPVSDLKWHCPSACMCGFSLKVVHLNEPLSHLQQKGCGIKKSGPLSTSVKREVRGNVSVLSSSTFSSIGSKPIYKTLLGIKWPNKIDIYRIIDIENWLAVSNGESYQMTVHKSVFLDVFLSQLKTVLPPKSRVACSNLPKATGARSQ